MFAGHSLLETNLLAPRVTEQAIKNSRNKFVHVMSDLLINHDARHDRLKDHFPESR